jgi:MFS family permease
MKGLAAIDWLGLLTSVGGVVIFLLGLEFGGVSFPWSSPTVICLIVFGALLLVIFLPIEWKVAKYPMMPLRLFSSRSRALGFVTNFCHGFSFIAGSYFLPLYFQAVLSATPFMAGVLQLAYIFALSFAVSFVGPIIKKWGDFKTPIVVGMFVMALGFGLFIYLPDYPNYARIIPAQLLAGFGAGPNFQGPLIALQAHSRPADVATMTAAFSWSRLCAQAISLVIGGVIFQNRMAAQSDKLAQAGVPKQTRDEITGGSAGAGIHAVQTLPGPARAIAQTAFTDSLQVMWIFYTAIMVVGFVASLFISKKKLEEKHEVRKLGLEAEEKDRQERLAQEAENNKPNGNDAGEKA